MRTIGVVTVARSDYGIYLPLLRAVQADPELKLQLFVTGMHLSPEFGSTVRVIEADGFPIEERIDMLLASDTPTGIAKSMGIGVMGFGGAFARQRPDILVVLGDRFETITAPLAALPYKLPVAHLHGGELTEGAMDDALRHAITKLSHLHFVSTEVYGQRVIQMGEEPWRVVVSGAPSLDQVATMTLLSPEALRGRFQLPFDTPPLLVTYHPVTLEYEQTTAHIDALLQALELSGQPIVFTLPNADQSGREIIQRIRAFVSEHASSVIVENLGSQAYFSMMAWASAMVGNSSSGIIEAASFRLPVVNIGTRQHGRVHDRNVLQTAEEAAAILAAIEQALSPAFRRSLDDLVNPYGDGQASARIIQTLKSVPLNDRLIRKKFHDLDIGIPAKPGRSSHT